MVLAAGAVALVIAGYIAASRRDVDATTEAAALVVIGAGLAAGLGWLALASGIDRRQRRCCWWKNHNSTRSSGASTTRSFVPPRASA